MLQQRTYGLDIHDVAFPGVNEGDKFRNLDLLNGIGTEEVERISGLGLEAKKRAATTTQPGPPGLLDCQDSCNKVGP